MPRTLHVLALTATLVTGAAACSPGGAVAPTPDSTLPGGVAANATVERVVDGDTVLVSFDGRSETVRLIGIDTPETVKPDTPVQCFGPEASALTTSLLPAGTAVRIERDVEARDHYGRLLGYVYRAVDGLFVNLELVATGHAVLLTYPPNVTHVAQFVDAANVAERADLGLWAACAG